MAEAAVTDALQHRVIEADGAVMIDHRLRRLVRRLQIQHPPEAPLPECHGERDVPFMRDPARLSEMIGMEMCADHPRDRLALQMRVEDMPPQITNFLRVEAGIDERPAVGVFDEVEIDVIEARNGDGHSHPEKAITDFKDFTVTRSGFQRVAYLIIVHCTCPDGGSAKAPAALVVDIVFNAYVNVKRCRPYSSSGGKLLFINGKEGFGAIRDGTEQRRCRRQDM